MDKAVGVFGRAALCAVVLAGLAACGGGGSGSDSSGTGAPAGSTTPPASASPPASSGSNSSAPSSPNVSPSNAAPNIGGTPSVEVLVGQAYSFTPNAKDVDGDSLKFSISSKPSWAAFNSATGQLSGTPGAADVGTHEDIAISVSDGHAIVSLAAFAINVVQQSNGSVTLAWEPPTENTDGSPLTNLSGYKIHYGTQSGAYSKTITLNNAGLTRHVVENLTPGTYFFAISAVTANGSESDFSSEASKAI